MEFPATRLRRLRATPALRSLVRETRLEPGALMRPEAVAEAYWALYQQPADAWTFEQEIRPFGEKW